MIRTFTFVMVVFLCTFRVEASSPFPLKSSPDALNIITVPDTVSTSSGRPLLSSQQLTFQRRLDSLEKSVPLNYNQHVQGYLDIYLQRKEQIGKMLGLSKYYFPIFEKALKEAGLPDELKFLTVIESAFNPHAVSRSGAVGPWQFMFITARGYGLTMDSYVDERKDPVKASLAAAHYFVDAYKRIGDWLLTIAAFNCGTGAVTRAIQKSGGVADFWRVRPFLPKETQNYVPAFIATVYVMNYYKNHDIEQRPAGFNIYTDVVQVNKRIAISSVANATGLDLGELLTLNPSYKKQIVNGSVEFPKSLVIPAVDNRIYASLYEVLNGYEAEKPKAVLASVRETVPQAKVSATQYHRVKPGQNLSVIASRYGVEVQDLKAWNELKNSTLAPGQSLKISGPSKSSGKATESRSFNYVVKVGDTLSGIAEKFKGLTVSQIKALNGLSKSAIVPGMMLKINLL